MKPTLHYSGKIIWPLMLMALALLILPLKPVNAVPANCPVNYPVLPSNVHTTAVGDVTIDLAWTNANCGTEANTLIYVSKANGQQVFNRTVAHPGNSTQLTWLEPGTAYIINVYAQDNLGNSSDTSITLNVSTLAHPADPSNLSVDLRGTTFARLNWKDNAPLGPDGTAEDSFEIDVADSVGHQNGVSTKVYNLGSSMDLAGIQTGNLSYMMAGLLPNTTYWIGISAFKTNVGWSNLVNLLNPITTLSKPPSNVTAVANNNDNTKINVSWAGSANDLFFVTNNTKHTNSGWIQNNSYVESNLECDTLYSFSVKAKNQAGEETADVDVTAQTGACNTVIVQPPAAPSDVSSAAFNYSLSMQVAWKDNSENEDGFELSKSTDGVNFDAPIQIPKHPGTGFPGQQVNNLQPNTNYWFRVRSYNANGYSNYAVTPASLKTLPQVPAAPSNISASAASASAITVSWTDNATDETGFDLFKSTDNNNYTPINLGTSQSLGGVNTGALRYNVNNLLSNTEYYFTIKAKNANGSSQADLPVSATTLAAAIPPGAPANVLANPVANDNTKIALSWTGTAGLNYLITEAAGLISSGWVSGSSYIATGLQCNTQYTFSIKARDSQLLESSNSGASAKTGACAQAQIQSAPTNPQIIADQASINTINNNVLLNLSAQNAPTEMLLSNNANFNDAAWHAFFPSKYWNFSSTFSGTAFVYAKFKNATGESLPVYTTYTVNRPIATTPVASPPANFVPSTDPSPTKNPTPGASPTVTKPKTTVAPTAPSASFPSVSLAPANNQTLVSSAASSAPENINTSSTPSTTADIITPIIAPNSYNPLAVPLQTNQSVMVGLVTLIWGVTVLLICFVLYWAMAKIRK